MPDIVTGKIFVDGEKGITATKLNQIISQAVIQPDFVTTKPSSSTLDPTDQLLEVKASGSYATITGSQLINSVGSGLTPTITAVRLRSFNAIGNCNFEVDQRLAGAGIANPANGVFVQDRWYVQKVGTMTVTAGQGATTPPNVQLPGTSYMITGKILSVTLTGQEASLGASDVLALTQTVEGPALRELYGDVHSVSILCRCSVPLKFAVALRDPPTPTKSLVSLCTLTTANTWTLFTLPNIPVWPSGNFSINPGSAGYMISVTLAAGSTYTTTAGTWATGNFYGATGQDNFCAQAVNSNFQIAFIQHEPGNQCTTLMDCPFGQNLDGPMGCQRYYQKNHPYGTKPGVAVGGIAGYVAANQGHPVGPIRFPKVMAKAPTITGYSGVSGTINTVRDITNSADRTITAPSAVFDSGFSGFTVSGFVTTIYQFSYDYTADTGW